MAGIEIREYCGDFEDLVQFNRRVWIPEYAGKMWFSLPDVLTLRSWGRGGGCMAAYHGTKIVGTIFSIPHSLRIRSSVLPTALITGLAVDPDHGRIALHLVDESAFSTRSRELHLASAGLRQTGRRRHIASGHSTHAHFHKGSNSFSARATGSRYWRLTR